MKFLPNQPIFSSGYLQGVLTAVILFITFTGCSSHNPSEDTEPVVVELTDFETIISFEDEILATPVILKYAGNSTLFVYDEGLGKVIMLNEKGGILQEFGQRGPGPGEFQRVNNLFLAENHLYVTDPGKYSIHKFEIDGELAATLLYGEVANQANTPPPPPMGMSVRAKNITNQPAVTSDGNVILSSIVLGDSVQSIFKLNDWDGNSVSTIGEVPEGSTFILDNEKIKEDVSNRVVPSYYRADAYPVQDKMNPDEYFLVYSALPLIAKYNSTGEMLWEMEIPSTPETDSVTTRFFNVMEKMQRSDIRFRILLQYYVAGVSSPDGDLFLAMDRNPLWIHQFDSAGKLIRRYKLVSDGVAIEPVFDIDFENNRILIATEEGEIRAYSF